MEQAAAKTKAGQARDVYKRQLIDKSRLSIRLQPPYSEERRQKASQYARQNGFSGKAK